MINPYQKQFDMRQKNSTYWYNKSHDLFVSAHVLWKATQETKELEINCWDAYKMLMGLSFELLFKARCISTNISFKPIHDLVKLAETANLNITEEENKILKILSEYVIWDSKYPTPTRIKDLENHWKHQKELSNDKLDFENLLPIWRRISDSFMGNIMEV